MDLHLSLVDDGRPLSRQIYEQIRDAVLDGRLVPGDRLPPTRELAATLEVSRNTVSAAFDQLSGEGYLSGRAGVGTFVSREAGLERSSRHQRTASPLHVASIWRQETPPAPDLAADRPDFDFRPGIPDAGRFPYATWRRLVSIAWRQSAVDTGVYADPAGVLALRRAIARHLGVSRGLRVDASEVVVANGVQQAVALACQVLVDPGDVVAVEDPGYLPVRRVFEAARATVVDVPVDEHGLVVEALPARARVVYVTPAHQFPLGVPMSLPRRLALLDWARAADAAVIEDDYDTDFRYTGRPVDPLHALDPTGRVVYVGSFSKTMLPILRLGYSVVPSNLIPVFRRARFVADWHGPTSTQLALAQFIDEGHLVRHIRSARRDYQARRDRIMAILDADFRAELEPIPTVAGLHLTAWSRAADSDTVDSWVSRADGEGVALQSLTSFTHRPDARPGLIIGFGGIRLDQVDEGMRRIRRILTRR